MQARVLPCFPSHSTLAKNVVLHVCSPSYSGCSEMLIHQYIFVVRHWPHESMNDESAALSSDISRYQLDSGDARNSHHSSSSQYKDTHNESYHMLHHLEHGHNNLYPCSSIKWPQACDHFILEIRLPALGPGHGIPREI